MYTLSRCTLNPYQGNNSSIVWVVPFRCTPFPSVHLFPLGTGLQFLFKQRKAPLRYTVYILSSCTRFPNSSIYSEKFLPGVRPFLGVRFYPIRATIPPYTPNSSFGCTPFLSVHLFPVQVTIPPYTGISSVRCTPFLG